MTTQRPGDPTVIQVRKSRAGWFIYEPHPLYDYQVQRVWTRDYGWSANRVASVFATEEEARAKAAELKKQPNFERGIMTREDIAKARMQLSGLERRYKDIDLLQARLETLKLPNLNVVICDPNDPEIEIQIEDDHASLVINSEIIRTEAKIVALQKEISETKIAVLNG